MSAASRKSAAAKPATKKAVSKSTLSHPSWADMIKECIADHPEDSRTGVSRPQIKKYVETKYKLEIGSTQSIQLSKAITTGAEKGTFSLPKGISGKIKLTPKAKVDTSAKENKPASKAKTTTAKSMAAKKPVVKKPAAKPATTTTRTKALAKKVVAGKKAAPAKKKTTASKRASAKKAVTGTTTTKKATAIKKAPVKKAAPKSTRGRKPVTRRA